MTCRLFHDWGKWQDVVMTVTDMKTGSKALEGWQQRVCNRCGKKQTRLP